MGSVNIHRCVNYYVGLYTGTPELYRTTYFHEFDTNKYAHHYINSAGLNQHYRFK